MPQRERTFARDEKFPSYFVNILQDLVSGLAPAMYLQIVTGATSIEAVAPEPLEVSSIPIEGRWRFNEATVSRAHPGGASGTYDVWAVALDNDVDNSPASDTDHTTRTWDLRITASGVNPSGAGVEIFDKIGEVDWDGSRITRLRQLAGKVTRAMATDGRWPAAGVSLPFNGSLAKIPPFTLLEDGSVVNKADYPDLFDRIGTLHNTGGETADQFRLPDSRGRLKVGRGTHADVDTIGENDGLSLANRRPKHAHADGTLIVASHTHPAGGLWTGYPPLGNWSIEYNMMNLSLTGNFRVSGHDWHTHGYVQGDTGAGTADVTGATADAGPAYITADWVITY